MIRIFYLFVFDELIIIPKFSSSWYSYFFEFREFISACFPFSIRFPLSYF